MCTRLAPDSFSLVSLPRLAPTSCSRVLLPRLAPASCSRVLLPRLAPASCSRVLLPRLAPASCSRVLLPRLAPASCSRVFRLPGSSRCSLRSDPAFPSAPHSTLARMATSWILLILLWIYPGQRYRASRIILVFDPSTRPPTVLDALTAPGD